MNKRIGLCLLLAFVLTFLVSFALCESQWERDPREHWMTDENGERINVGAHQLTDIVCEICQSNVWLFEDGTCDISNYNAYEDLIRYSYYDADGALLDDYTYVYTYNDSGMKLMSFTYYFGILVEETEYGIDPFGESIVKKAIGYNDDGSESLTMCDEYGNTILSKVTDADGNPIFEEVYEYTYGEDGFPTHTKKTSRFDDGTTFIVETDEKGNCIFDTQIDADGAVVYAYDYSHEYDSYGRMIRELISENGRPVYESLYAYTDDPEDLWGYQCMAVDYFEDGSKTVYEMDEFGDTLSETSYDPEGNIID